MRTFVVSASSSAAVSSPNVAPGPPATSGVSVSTPMVKGMRFAAAAVAAGLASATMPSDPAA